MKEEDLKRKVLEHLNTCSLMVLATVSKDCYPLASTLYFYVDENFIFYFITRAGSHKASNIEANNRVALSASVKPYNVEVVGRAEILTDDQTRNLVMDKFAEWSFKSTTIWPPIFRYSENEYVVYCIQPERIRVLDTTGQNIYEITPPFFDLV